jgi:hypothetical protein
MLAGLLTSMCSGSIGLIEMGESSTFRLLREKVQCVRGPPVRWQSPERQPGCKWEEALRRHWMHTAFALPLFIHFKRVTEVMHALACLVPFVVTPSAAHLVKSAKTLAFQLSDNALKLWGGPTDFPVRKHGLVSGQHPMLATKRLLKMLQHLKLPGAGHGVFSRGWRSSKLDFLYPPWDHFCDS